MVAAAPEGGARPEPGAGESLDCICGVRILQNRRGYRFNMDPVLLAHFAAGRSKAALEGPVLELGTGVGVVPLILARKFNVDCTGMEVQPTLFALAERNRHLNACARQVSFVLADWRDAAERFKAGSFHNLLCNPPYRAAAAGRLSPQPERALARHELTGTLSDLAGAARHLLADSGGLWMVYPVARLPELMGCLTGHGLEPKQLRLVHPRASAPAKLTLLQAVKGGKPGLEVLAPLFLHSDEGQGFSPEVAAMIA